MPTSKQLQVYQKLQKRLDELPIGYPATESGVELRILQHLFTPLEAEIAIELNLLPEPVERIYKRTKKIIETPEELTKLLENLSKKGCIIRHTTRKGEQVYSLAFLAIGMFEFQVNRLTKEFYQDFHQYLDEAFRDELLNTKYLQLRQIPTEGSITPDFPILPYDDIRKIIQDLKGPILAANCICKQGQDLLGKPCKVTDDREICIILGNAARNYHELGRGRYIEKKELISILQKAEKDGLVVSPSATKKLFCICLCCHDCCELLTSLQLQDHPASYVDSNYYAQVNTEMCNGCGICVRRCQMNAITIIGEENEKKSLIDLKKCIGCGLCVPTCKPKAMTLQIKEHIIEPPDDASKLYLAILRNRIGNANMLLKLIKVLLKKKI